MGTSVGCPSLTVFPLHLKKVTDTQKTLREEFNIKQLTECTITLFAEKAQQKVAASSSKLKSQARELFTHPSLPGSHPSRSKLTPKTQNPKAARTGSLLCCKLNFKPHNTLLQKALLFWSRYRAGWSEEQRTKAHSMTLLCCVGTRKVQQLSHDFSVMWRTEDTVVLLPNHSRWVTILGLCAKRKTNQHCNSIQTLMYVFLEGGLNVCSTSHAVSHVTLHHKGISQNNPACKLQYHFVIGIITRAVLVLEVLEVKY